MTAEGQPMTGPLPPDLRARAEHEIVELRGLLASGAERFQINTLRECLERQLRVYVELLAAVDQGQPAPERYSPVEQWRAEAEINRQAYLKAEARAEAAEASLQALQQRVQAVAQEMRSSAHCNPFSGYQTALFRWAATLTQPGAAQKE